MLTVEQIERIITAEFMGQNDDTFKAFRAAAEKVHALVKPDHDMHVMSAVLENEITSTLLDMAVATTLATLFEEEGGGRSNVQISTMSMEHMQQHYKYTSEIDGMVRTIKIELREDSPLNTAEGWREPSNRHGLTEVAPPEAGPIGLVTHPPAEPKEYNRPEWYIRSTGALWRMGDHADAARNIRSYVQGDPTAVIENRWCGHTDCPSTGCNHDASLRDEVTSD